jgi:hypothetical protein
LRLVLRRFLGVSTLASTLKVRTSWDQSYSSKEVYATLSLTYVTPAVVIYPRASA